MLSTSDNLHLFTSPRKPNSAEQSTAISNYLLRIFYSMKLSFKNKLIRQNEKQVRCKTKSDILMQNEK